MRASAKDRDDRHEVFCDASSWVRFLLMENHESSAKFSHEPFEELDTEAREAVSIGDHNRSDSSLQDKLQKGTQSGPLEIEAGADVAEDADGSVGEALRALLDKESLLIESVRDLLAGGHAGVTSGDAGVFRLRPFAARGGLRDIDAAMSTCRARCGELTSFDPVAYSARADAVVPSGDGHGDRGLRGNDGGHDGSML